MALKESQRLFGGRAVAESCAGATDVKPFSPVCSLYVILLQRSTCQAWRPRTTLGTAHFSRVASAGQHLQHLLRSNEGLTSLTSCHTHQDNSNNNSNDNNINSNSNIYNI